MTDKQKAAMRRALYLKLFHHVGHWSPDFLNRVVDELLDAAIAAAEQERR